MIPPIDLSGVQASLGIPTSDLPSARMGSSGYINTLLESGQKKDSFHSSKKDDPITRNTTMLGKVALWTLAGIGLWKIGGGNILKSAYETVSKAK